MLGRDVVAAAESAGHDVIALARADLDITDADAVRAAIADASPDAVINCAAWTDVDGAEADEEAATRINGDGAGNLAAAAPFLVHVSSDYVFDGTATEPYTEGDPTGPRSAYGRSKLAGEHAVAEQGEHAIVRTAWVFGPHGKNFIATMLKLAEDRDEVNVVADQIGCPTFTGHLAPALVQIAEQRLSRHPPRRRRRPVLVAGVRAGRVRGGRHRHHRQPRDDRRVPAPRAAAPVVRPALHPPRRARAPVLAPRPDRLLELGGPAMKLLVCGGAGFIGSNFVRQRITEHGDEVVVLDKLTYAGREENLADVKDSAGFGFIRAGIEDADAVREAMEDRDAVVNFAAETHVDRSIAEPDAFVTTHAQGTYVLLEAARAAGLRYVQVSTDEVYGSIDTGSFTEESPLAPSSPYSATKAGADLLVWSYFHTYGLPTLIARGSNNYGPFQYPEKLIPLMILNALHGDKLPVYGDGMQVRNWIYVEDFARAIGHVLEHGEPGNVYNAGGPDECANLEVVQRIIQLTGGDESLIEYVTDRPGHDRRYSLSSEKVRALGWEPRMRFGDGLAHTVAWYRDNPSWWEPIRSGDYRAYYERQYGRSLG